MKLKAPSPTQSLCQGSEATTAANCASAVRFASRVLGEAEGSQGVCAGFLPEGVGSPVKPEGRHMQ
eukprot:4487222-Alexandrium_andersonii.AAC.1